MILRALALGLSIALIAGCYSAPSRQTQPPSNPSTDIGRFVADRQPWTFKGDRGWAYYTPNSIIRTTSTDRKILERLPPFVELSILHYQSDITRLPRPAQPIETYFFDTRNQWETLTRSLMGKRAGVYLSIERGGYSAKQIGVFYDIGPKDSFVICAHEGWHQYSHSTFKDPMPVWLDEGVACMMEGFRWDPQFPDHPRFMAWANTERFDQLRDAYNSDALMPIHSLLTLRPQDLIIAPTGQPTALIYYAQVWALIHFLNEGEGGRYSSTLEQILQDIAIGNFRNKLSPNDLRKFNTRRIGSGTLLSFLPKGTTLQQLDLEYQRFVAQIVRVGSRNKIVMGKSPITR
ncbi:MAG: DUF1570 domain-containing protein [Phycisphaerales bacterium]|nr:DUF1570 domain-containing protein [Phycisphaerales bacterium]